MEQEHSANTKFKLSLLSHRMGRKKEPSQTEARREKSPKLSRDEFRDGTYYQGSGPPGQGAGRPGSPVYSWCIRLVSAEHDPEDELGSSNH